MLWLLNSKKSSWAAGSVLLTLAVFANAQPSAAKPSAQTAPAAESVPAQLAPTASAGSSSAPITIKSASGTETILSPRSKAEHEAEMKRLQALYGPKEDPRIAAAKGEPPADVVSTAAPTTPSTVAEPPVATLSKVRIDLTAVGRDRFRFLDTEYTRDELLVELQEVSTRHQIDHIVLLQQQEAIALTHLIELAKLSETLKTPAMYQSGNELRAVATK